MTMVVPLSRVCWCRTFDMAAAVQRSTSGALGAEQGLASCLGIWEHLKRHFLVLQHCSWRVVGAHAAAFVCVCGDEGREVKASFAGPACIAHWRLAPVTTNQNGSLCIVAKQTDSKVS